MQKQPNLSKILKQLDAYEPISLLGSGSYGEVYKGIPKGQDNLSNKITEVAMKIEKSRFSQFQKEYKITKDLLEDSSSEQARIPNIFQSTTIDGYQILIYELLGPNLEDLFALCNQRFSLKTIITLAIQSVQRLEYMHSRGYLHRDIKPSNFLMGGNHTAKYLYIIDFGLSSSYLKINNTNSAYEHIKQQRNRSLVGSLRYASVNSMNGLSQGRKDDLESLAYMFAYFLNQGSLPWKDMFAASKEQLVEQICKKKQAFEFGLNVPQCFQQYLTYVKELKFAEEPDYQYLITLFQNQFKQMNAHLNYEYDWSHLIQDNANKPLQNDQQINNIYEWLNNENQETKVESAKLQQQQSFSSSSGSSTFSSNDSDNQQIQNNHCQQQYPQQEINKKQKVLIGNQIKKSSHHNLLTCFGF